MIRLATTVSIKLIIMNENMGQVACEIANMHSQVSWQLAESEPAKDDDYDLDRDNKSAGDDQPLRLVFWSPLRTTGTTLVTAVLLIYVIFKRLCLKYSQ